VVCTRVLARRVPHDPNGFVLRTVVRCLTAAALPGLGAVAVVVVLERLLGVDATGSAAATVLGGALLLAGYLALARRLRVPEVDELLRPLLGQLVRSGR
jgi:putative peptidoglycan lipid II flippase